MYLYSSGERLIWITQATKMVTSYLVWVLQSSHTQSSCPLWSWVPP